VRFIQLLLLRRYYRSREDEEDGERRGERGSGKKVKNAVDTKGEIKKGKPNRRKESKKGSDMKHQIRR
jgi:membrane protein implicated in regulation of membrane protease activity